VHQRLGQLLDRFVVLPLSADVLRAGLKSAFSDKAGNRPENGFFSL